MRTALLLIALSAPVAAQEHDHVAEANGLRVVHAWTPATDGPEALVFMEIENRGDAPATLTGAAADVAGEAALVGHALAGGESTWTPLPGVPVEAGGELRLEPNVLAIRLSGLAAPLEEGAHLDVEVLFGDLVLPVEVAVEPEGATAHSHAGHVHE